MEEIDSMIAKPFFRDTVKPAQYMELGCPRALRVWKAASADLYPLNQGRGGAHDK
jgi:hypothetical protein